MKYHWTALKTIVQNMGLDINMVVEESPGNFSDSVFCVSWYEKVSDTSLERPRVNAEAA